mgnify:CR=1 FL=1
MLAIAAQHDRGKDAELDGAAVTRTDQYGKQEQFQTVDRGMMIRKFANGNAHVFFSKWTLLDINRALAEFYGEVLPDAEDNDVPIYAGTAVAKDLQFHWSPSAVVATALDYAGIPELSTERDLPVASFADAGTNVPTVMLRIRVPAEARAIAANAHLMDANCVFLPAGKLTMAECRAWVAADLSSTSDQRTAA